MKFGYLGSIPDVLSGTVQSGDIAPNSVVSGTIGSGAAWGAFGPTRILASGTVGGFDFGSGAVMAGALGSGVVVSGNLSSGLLGGINQFGATVRLPGTLQVSGLVETFAGINAYAGISVETGSLVAKSGITLDGSESGFITALYLGSGSVQSGVYASGSISQLKFASGLLTSGVYVGSGTITGQAGPVFNIASGTLGQFDHASGSLFSGLFASGAVQIFDAMQTVEAINAMHAVAISSGGRLVQAMAGSGLRIPAIGIVTASGLSGSTLVYYSDGRYMHPGGGANWSGKAGQHLYVGSGGEIVAQSLLVSGQRWQRIGVAVSGGIIVLPDLTITSGALAAQGTNY